MIQSQKQQIISHAAAYMADKLISQAELARQTKIPTNYLSYMMNGKEEMSTGKRMVTIGDNYFSRLARFTGFQQIETMWGHFDTLNYRLIIDALKESRAERIRLAIDGPTGSGKTYSVRRYKQENPTGVYVVTSADDLTAKGFMVELAEACGVKAIGSRSDLRKAVVRKLEQEEDPQVIVEEAENLKDSSYGPIKSICDSLEGLASFVLVGANDYENTLADKALRGKGCFPQIYRRFKGNFIDLLPWDLADVKDVCKQLGITSKNTVNFLFDRSRNMGELQDALTRVHRQARRLGQPISDDLVIKALSKNSQ